MENTNNKTKELFLKIIPTVERMIEKEENHIKEMLEKKKNAKKRISFLYCEEYIENIDEIILNSKRFLLNYKQRLEEYKQYV